MKFREAQRFAKGLKHMHLQDVYDVEVIESNYVQFRYQPYTEATIIRVGDNSLEELWHVLDYIRQIPKER